MSQIPRVLSGLLFAACVALRAATVEEAVKFVEEAEARLLRL